MSEPAKCIVCDSTELDYFTHQYGGDGYGDKCCTLADGPNEARCENCDAEYVEGELVTDYYISSHMPESVVMYLMKQALEQRA